MAIPGKFGLGSNDEDRHRQAIQLPAERPVREHFNQYDDGLSFLRPSLMIPIFSHSADPAPFGPELRHLRGQPVFEHNDATHSPDAFLQIRSHCLSLSSYNKDNPSLDTAPRTTQL